MTLMTPKSLALGAALLLSACVDATTPATSPAPATPPAPVAAVETGAAKPVAISRALELFDAVCVATAPDRFASAKAAMAANQVTAPSPLGTATMFSTEEDLSFQIMGSGEERRCSMVFGTTSGDRAVASAVVTRFGTTGLAEGGMAAFKDQKSNRLVIFEPAMSAGGHRMYHLVAYAKAFD